MSLKKVFALSLLAALMAAPTSFAATTPKLPEKKAEVTQKEETKKPLPPKKDEKQDEKKDEKNAPAPAPEKKATK